MNFRLAVNLALLLLLGTLSLLAFQYRDAILLQMQTSLEGLGLGTAGIIFVATTSLAALVLFPVSVLMLFSGAYFGMWWGFLFSMAGFAGGSMLAFLTARYLAHDLVARLLPASAMKVLQQLGASGWQMVAILRAVGIVPGVIVNYALGVTPLRFGTYAWASVVFTIPNAFILTYAGVAGEEFARNGGAGKLLLAVSLIAGASSIAYLARKRFVS
ncbi:MAG: VTT domain-containing protein [Pseudomonadota bacterium]